MAHNALLFVQEVENILLLLIILATYIQPI